MLRLDVIPHELERGADHCGIVGHAEDRQHVRQAIEWHDEICERREQGGAHMRRRAAIERAVVGGQQILDERNLGGKLAELEAALDNKAGESGAGTFTKWLGYMKASKYAEAKALT